MVNDNKCFFRMIAVASMLVDKEIRADDLIMRRNEKASLITSIKNKTEELFRMFADVYKLTAEQILTFQGVSVKIMPAMEFLFKCKIMVFIPKVSKEGQVKLALLSKSSNRLIFEKKMNANLILFNNHYYLIMKKRLLMDKLRCLVCGQNFVWMKSLLKHRAGSSKK